MQAIKSFLKSFVKDLNTYNERGNTELIEATIKRKYDIVKELLELGANPNIGNQKSGTTPLMYASANPKSKDILKLLLKYGANPNARDTEGETALFYAVYNKGGEVLRILLDNGAKPNIQNNIGETPLFIYSKANKLDDVRVLLSFGANAFLETNNGITPFMIAGGFGYKFLLDYFMKYVETPTGIPLYNYVSSKYRTMYNCADSDTKKYLSEKYPNIFKGTPKSLQKLEAMNLMKLYSNKDPKNKGLHIFTEHQISKYL